MARSTSTQRLQYGVEVAPGTAVPADRLLSSLSVSLNPQVESDSFRPKGFKYPTVVTPNKEWGGGDLEGTATYDEVVVPLSSVLGKATVAEAMDGATATGAYRWSFSPDSSAADDPAIFTLEEGDSSIAERMTHAMVTDFDLDISRSEVSLGGSLFGQRVETGIVQTAGATPLAADLVPILPGQVCIYIADTPAALESAPGVSDPAKRQGTALSVHPSIGGRFDPVWYLNCVLPSFGTYVEAPEPDFTLDYMVEANAAGLEWLDHFRTGKTQFVRVEATGPRIYEGATAAEDVYYRLTWDFAVKTLEPGEKSDEDGVYAIAPSLQVVHDPTWGKASEVTVTNKVAAL
jgi:hypothetical protein